MEKDLYDMAKCSVCKKEFEYGSMYEYRGAVACEGCFEELQVKRNAERNQIIEEEKHKTDRFKGLDLSDSATGKANKEILKADIEIASKESKRISDYENAKSTN